jgi:glycerol-3-phosphate acyltransferase PlsY
MSAEASPLVQAAAALAAYVLGTLPTASWVAGRHGIDPTRVGSGNPGATNVMRTVGRRAGALTLAGDVLKGVAAAGIGWAVGGRDLGAVCGAAAVAGHVLPVTRNLRGGRGVATGFGMTVLLYPLAAVAGVAWFYLVRGLRGRPSLLSQAGIVALPAIAAATGAGPLELVALTACAALILVKLWTGRRSPAEVAADEAAR